ncbi:uncharacterized protein G2W53_040724 [Senna tora]|uniref:Uncharacterized protein n=1 Tax=Senna tora TaxID=362788 RepID=A0A834SG35_9FABA|nr:uncharacterized protein G2W53_040724 [Senna tora]
MSPTCLMDPFRSFLKVFFYAQLKLDDNDLPLLGTRVLDGDVIGGMTTPVSQDDCHNQLGK